MRHIVTSLIVLAALASPVAAFEPSAIGAVSLETARHDRAAVSREWEVARHIAERRAAEPGIAPLTADDLLVAIEHGDDALADASAADTPAAIEAAVRRAWAAVAHVVNVTVAAAGGAGGSGSDRSISI